MRIEINIAAMHSVLVAALRNKNHQSIKDIVKIAIEGEKFLEIFAVPESEGSIYPIEIAFSSGDSESFNLILEGASTAGVLYEFLLYNKGSSSNIMTIFFAKEDSFGEQEKSASYSREQAYLKILEVAKEDKDFVKIYTEAAIASSSAGLNKAIDTITEVATDRNKLEEILACNTSCFGHDGELLKEATLLEDLESSLEDLESPPNVEAIVAFSAALPQIGTAFKPLYISNGESAMGEGKFSEESTDFAIGSFLARFLASPGIHYAENYINDIESPSITTYYIDHFRYSVSLKGIIGQSFAVIGFTASSYGGNSLVNSWLVAKIASDFVSIYDGSFDKDIKEYSTDLSIYIAKMMVSTVINYQYILPHYNEAKIVTTCVASVIPDLVSLAGSLAQQGTLYLYDRLAYDHDSN